MAMLLQDLNRQTEHVFGSLLVELIQGSTVWCLSHCLHAIKRIDMHGTDKDLQLVVEQY
jgi:hypothetical protein